MPTDPNVLAEVIGIVARLDPQKRVIGPDTAILTELDFDSLTMLDLIETLRQQFGVDFFQEPYSLDSLWTPKSIAAALSVVRPHDNVRLDASAKLRKES